MSKPNGFQRRPAAKGANSVFALTAGSVDASLLERKSNVSPLDGWEEDVGQDEKKGDSAPPSSFLKGILAAPRGGKGRGYRYRCRLNLGSLFSVNSAAGKYLQFLTGGTTFNINNISSTAEWSSLNSLFDEFFIHRADFHYHPLNKYSSNSSSSSSAAGTPGFPNNCACVVVAMQHDQAAYTDSTNACSQMMNNLSARWLNTADSWKFRWVNNEKFTPNGPVGDQTTGGMTQSWCNVSNTAKYGGYVQIATPIASAAAAAISSLLSGGAFGHVMVTFDVSFRQRS